MKSNITVKNKALKISLFFFALLSILVFSLGWYFTYAYGKTTKNLETESNYLELEANNQIETIQKYNRVIDYHDVVTDTLPDSKDISSFLADVEGIARKNNISLNQSTIGAVNTKAKQTNLDLSQTINKVDYYELQIRYTVEGSYQSFLKMLQDMSNLRRLNNISEIGIVKSRAETNNDIVQVNFIASIYIKK